MKTMVRRFSLLVSFLVLVGGHAFGSEKMCVSYSAIVVQIENLDFQTAKIFS